MVAAEGPSRSEMIAPDPPIQVTAAAGIFHAPPLTLEHPDSREGVMR